MWSVFKYVVDSPDAKHQDSAQAGNEAVKEIRPDDVVEAIKKEVNKNAENYIIALHYVDFPVLIHYGLVKLPDSPRLTYLHDYLEPAKEVRKILLMNKAEYIEGFAFLRKQIDTQKAILASMDQNTFDRLSAESGLEPYIINDLRTIWKNRRLEYLQQSLVHREEVYYKPREDHPLYQAFLDYLEDVYRRGVDRFKTFICVGSTFIGKSIFFTKFIVPEKYYIYHSNYLEYSKMPNQPNKIFRILDDINWEQVTSTELKMLMNRNISSVNIKYGYEYIFPLIPIIIMNAEDYTLFRKHFSDVWEFVERNSVVYPPQNGGDVIEEKIPLFSNEKCDLTDDVYLFNNILDIDELERCNINNMNEYIKNRLNDTKSWKYDTSKFIQMPKNPDMKIPNPEISRKNILKQYEDYILRKKTKEMAKEGKEEEKKPLLPWYREYPVRNRPTNGGYDNGYTKSSKGIKDINEMKEKKPSKYDDEDDYGEEDEDYDDDGYDDDETEMSGDDVDDDSEGGEGNFSNGFIEI